MKSVISILLVFTGFFQTGIPSFGDTDAKAEKKNLKIAREYFYKVGKEPCSAVDMESYLQKQDTLSPTLNAYLGAAMTMYAECVSLPHKKLKSFNNGKAHIEEAVVADPSNAEIRFIRYMVQNGAPKFLNYDNQEEDLKVWLNHYKNGLREDYDRKMAEAISKSEIPDEKLREDVLKIRNL